MTLEQLQKECLTCTKCELSLTRNNVVFGTGNASADVMFIGEAPGMNEDLEGRPFVGQSGKLLDSFLETAGLSRDDVYIANIVKCRPPENRNPKPNEQQLCIDYLRKQISLINPKILVCLGRIAAQKIIGRSILVTRDHGKFFEKSELLVEKSDMPFKNHDMLFLPTFHPAAILRNPRNKPLALEDFTTIEKKLNELKNNTLSATSVSKKVHPQKYCTKLQ